MPDIFDLDMRDLLRLRKFYKNAPRQFARATAGVLNNMAFGARKSQIREIHSSMTVRNSRFVQSKIRVTKARGILPISNQESTSGSVTGSRFTGWEEQETGKKSKLKRSFTQAARGGNFKSQVKPKARLRAKNKFYRPGQFKGRNQKARFMFMMRVLATRGGGDFITDKKQGKLTRGLYRFKGGKIMRLQNFEESTQPGRNKWNKRAVDKYLRRANLRRIWTAQLQRQLKM
jgi:hypothetical protein